MDAHIVHSCGHTRTVPAKGIQEVRKIQRWLKQVKCPTCQGK